MNKFILRIIIGLAVIILILVFLGFRFFLLNQQQLNFNFIEAKIGRIAKEVKVDGLVKPAHEVNLSFERSAKIASVNVKVGDKVKSGDVLAGLMSADLSAQLAQAQAALNSSDALLAGTEASYQSQINNFNNLVNGASPEDISISQTQITNAQKTVNDAKLNLQLVENKAQTDLNNLLAKTKDIINDAYAKAFDAVNIKTGGLFINANSENPALTFLTSDSIFELQVKSQRVAVNNDLIIIRNDINNFSATETGVENILSDVNMHLENIRNFYKDLSQLMNYAIISTAFSQTTLDTYRSNLNLGFNNLNSVLASLTGQSQAIVSLNVTNQNLITAAQTQLNQAENNLALTQKQLALKKAGASADQIAAQEQVVKQAKASVTAQQAAVNQAQANVLNVQTQLAKSTIVSPIDGTVTKADAKIGQIAPLGAPIISVISNGKFQVESYIEQEKIGTIKIGQNAEVTLDAYGISKIFTAKVTAIDPSETIINGSPAYKVTLEFINEDNLIRDGLSANVKIITEENNNAIIIPELSVIEASGTSLVLLPAPNNNLTTRQVTTGLKQNGLIEIISGLAKGEKVIDFGGLSN